MKQIHGHIIRINYDITTCDAVGRTSEYRLIEGSLYIAPVQSANKHLAIDSGDYLCTKNLRAFITPWLDASQPVHRYHVSRDISA